MLNFVSSLALSLRAARLRCAVRRSKRQEEFFFLKFDENVKLKMAKMWLCVHQISSLLFFNFFKSIFLLGFNEFKFKSQ